MGQLTSIVEERRMIEDFNFKGSLNNSKDSLEQLVRSPEFAAGLHGVLQHTSEIARKKFKQTVTDVSQDLRTVRFRAATGKLRSALFWKKKKKEKEGEEPAEKPDGGEDEKMD